MKEEELYERWFAYARSGRLLSNSGHRLRILEPGALNRVRGPDILSARFELDGAVYQSGVEFHSKAQDWYRHGHHLDAAYAGVLLHLCADNPNETPTAVSHRLNRKPIPTMVLPRLRSKAGFPALSCGSGVKGGVSLHQPLVLLARQRLAIKIRYFISFLDQTGPQRLFYEHFLRALGYPYNPDAFQQLALKLDWPLLQRLFADGYSFDYLLAAYMGQAGFLGAEASDLYTRHLQALYQKLRDRLPHAAMPDDAWTLAALRYHNHPHFRLAGWVEILLKRGSLPDSDLRKLLAARLPLAALSRNLQSYFSLSPEGYWQNHYALGRATSTRLHTFFGSARVDEIFFNLLIPFYSAQALLQGSNGFAAYLEDIYLHWPVSEWYGFIPRVFPWAVDAFPRNHYGAYNQALIHLDRTYCRPAFCNSCPLKRKNVDIKQLNL